MFYRFQYNKHCLTQNKVCFLHRNIIYSAFQLIMQMSFFLLKKYYRVIFTKYYFHSSANTYSQHYLKVSSNLFPFLGEKWLFYGIWLFWLITQVWQDIKKMHFKAVLCFIFPTFVSIRGEYPNERRRLRSAFAFF